MNKFFSFAFFCSCTQALFGQVTGYGSLSYGHNSNPMYNYLQDADQLKQTYVELNYEYDGESLIFKMHYVGGSMLFDQFVLRNYYEHRVSAEMFFRLTPSQEEEDSLATDTAAEDSSGTFFHTEVQTSARHDKSAFQEFDNFGFIWNNDARFHIGESAVLRLLNRSEYRQYPNLQAYSNFADILTLSLENGTTQHFTYGASVSVGLKNFAKAKYDTSLFEEQQSYVYFSTIDSVQVGMGNNRHWQTFTVPDSSASEKILLAKPKTQATYQLAFGTFAQWQWKSSSVRAELNYRVNSQSTLLTLVQNLSPFMLNEDLYNSNFHSHGLEARVITTFQLPAAISFTTTLETSQRIFETPAYDLGSGNVVNAHRKDYFYNAEFRLSKFFPINDGFGFDLSFETALLRNQSNDNFNDYSIKAYTFTFGLGF